MNETDYFTTSTSNISSLAENETLQVFESPPGVPAWIFDFVAYWELIVACIGSAMNLFVVFIWFTLSVRSANRRFNSQSKNRWFILSMTCGDLLFASVHAPMMYGWYSSTLEMTDGPCYITYGSTHISTTVSSISLLLLNVDKFIYLHWPLHYHDIVSTRKVIMLTVGTWMISLGWTFLFLFGPFMKRGPECSWSAQHHEFYVIFLVIFFLMPILLSTATSLYIATVAVRASLQEAASQAAYGISPNGTCMADYQSESVMVAEETTRSVVIPPPSNGHRMTLTSPTVTSIRPWRTITFVFSTTIWSTITYLPYRISFIYSTVTHDIQLTWYYPLFALMVIYPAGNPFITIFTQPPYRRRALDIFDSVRSGLKGLCFWRDTRKWQCVYFAGNECSVLLFHASFNTSSVCSIFVL